MDIPEVQENEAVRGQTRTGGLRADDGNGSHRKEGRDHDRSAAGDDGHGGNGHRETAMQVRNVSWQPATEVAGYQGQPAARARRDYATYTTRPAHVTATGAPALLIRFFALVGILLTAYVDLVFYEVQALQPYAPQAYIQIVIMAASFVIFSMTAFMRGDRSAPVLVGLFAVASALVMFEYGVMAALVLPGAYALLALVLPHRRVWSRGGPGGGEALAHDLYPQGFWPRLPAMLIDLELIFVAIAAATYLTDSFAVFAAVGAGAWAVVWLIPEAIFGRSPGKWLVGLKVLNRHGRTCGWRGSIIRNLIRIFEPWFFTLFEVNIQSKRQRLGDLAAGTYVVRRQPDAEE